MVRDCFDRLRQRTALETSLSGNGGERRAHLSHHDNETKVGVTTKSYRRCFELVCIIFRWSLGKRDLLPDSGASNEFLVICEEIFLPHSENFDNPLHSRLDQCVLPGTKCDVSTPPVPKPTKSKTETHQQQVKKTEKTSCGSSEVGGILIYDCGFFCRPTQLLRTAKYLHASALYRWNLLCLRKIHTLFLGEIFLWQRFSSRSFLATMKIACFSLVLALANAACTTDTVTVSLKDSSRKLTFTGFEPMVKRYVQVQSICFWIDDSYRANRTHDCSLESLIVLFLYPS